jgi:hypothetical protein
MIKLQYGLLDHMKFWSWKNGVGIATFYRLTVWVSSRGGDNRYAVLTSVLNVPEIHSVLCKSALWLFPRCKDAGPLRSLPPSSAEGEHKQRYTVLNSLSMPITTCYRKTLSFVSDC